MALEDQYPVNTSVASGSTTFPFDFKISKYDDLKVEVDAKLKIFQTDYYVTGVGEDNGGEVIFLKAPDCGTQVVVYRDCDNKRDTDYKYQGEFRESVVDNDFDRIYMILQQISRDIGRSIKLPIGEKTTSFETISIEERANLLIGFDSSGNFKLLANPSDATATITPTSGAVSLWGRQLYPVDTIEDLRDFPGGSVVGRVQPLGYYDAGDGGGGPARRFVSGAEVGTYVDNGGSIIVPRDNDGSSAWLWDQPNMINVKTFGMRGDGTYEDVIMEKIKKVAGSMIPIYFPSTPSNTYYFSTAFDFTDCILSTDPGVCLSVENGVKHYRKIKTLTNIKLINRAKGKTVTLLPNDNENRFFGGGRSNFPSGSGYTQKKGINLSTVQDKLYTYDFSSYVDSGLYPTVSENEFRVDKDSGGNTIFLGLEFAPEVGHYYEFCMFSASSSSSSKGYFVGLDTINSEMRGIEIMDKQNSFSVEDNEINMIGVDYPNIWSRISRHSMPSESYVFGPSHSVLVGAYVSEANKIDYFSNHLLIGSLTMPTGNVEKLFLGFDNGNAKEGSSSGIWYGVDYNGKPSFLGKKKKIVISFIGDSLTAGSGQNTVWPDLMKEWLEGFEGIGSVSLSKNLAVNGDKLSDQIAYAQASDFSEDDVVCVLIGTNDIAQGTAVTSFYANLESLESIILLSNPSAKIIFGLPPMFSVTANGYKGGRIRSALAKFAADNGHGIADPLGAVGENLEAMTIGDNVHPDLPAIKAIAAAFTAEIASIFKVW